MQLDIFTAQQLRDKGIQTAIDSADLHNENWSLIAYDFLLKYIKTNKEFLTEDVRMEAEKVIPNPPSKRAWGGIIVKAVKSGLIKRVGYRCVKNPIAHMANATLWEVI